MAIPSYNTILKRGDGATPEVFTAVAKMGDISGPNLEAQTEDATIHDATGYAQVIPTILDGGELSFPIDYTPTDGTHSAATGLIYDWKNRLLKNYQMVWPDATTWTFPCYITKFSAKAPVKGKLTADVTLKISGAPTLA